MLLRLPATENQSKTENLVGRQGGTAEAQRLHMAAGARAVGSGANTRLYRVRLGYFFLCDTGRVLSADPFATGVASKISVPG